nr:MAG TPA: hypothetical protein [Caudoviricetes sp.]
MLQKHAKIFKGTNQTWRSKKPWQQNKTNKRGPQHSKGSLKVGPTPHKQSGDQTKRDTHHTIYVMPPPPPSPIRPRTPRRSAHPSLPVENPVDNSSNPYHNVTAIMWKTPKPVENPMETPPYLWITLWITSVGRETHHHI